jgi:fused signal recognition particle receptor
MFDAFTGANDDFFDELEEALILADTGAELSAASVETLRERVKRKGLRGRKSSGESFKAFCRGVSGRYSFANPGNQALRYSGYRRQWRRKTTTIGKLSARLSEQNKRVLLCAADTFRAAAAEQLSIWADRTKADIVKHTEGSDPGAVIYDGIQAAKARGADVIICDTAGRLHNKQNLMNELSKISRIIDRELPGASRETLLVIDATTGQNGLIQAKAFGEAANVSGIVLTKLDGTAKGGIVFAVARELNIPVKLIGVGEKADDLLDFDPSEFVRALLA